MTFENFLIENGQTSFESLIDSLQNWNKKSLTFQRAVETVEKMKDYIEKLEQEKMQNILRDAELIGGYVERVRDTQKKNEKLNEKIVELREKLDAVR